jgi:S-formylglutathione hydrolase FrmB
MHPFLALKLQSGIVPTVVYTVALVALFVLATKRPFKRWLPIQLLGALIGLGVGYVLAWLISDVWNLFDVELSAITHLWFGVGFAGVGFAIAGIARARVWRKVVASTSIVLFILALAVGVNKDIGEFPTLASLVDSGTVKPLHIPSASVVPGTTTEPATSVATPATAAIQTLAETWHAPASMPKVGTVGSVTIPGTVSNFHARSAIVYLPPAALVANAPRLPVLEMLSGQPGQPSNVLTSGQLNLILNAYAAEHEGLAPIMVIPDQLGAAANNPMCVDSPLGNAATYLTTDVPNWINAHLHVMTARTAWAIGGFSEGGTCSIQLGAKYSSVFGSIVDISGQAVPHNGSIASTIQKAFHGSPEEFAAAAPAAVIAAHAPFTDTLGIFAVGQNDTRYGVDSITVSTAARAAGMDTHYFQSPATAHDWHTVQYAIHLALPLLYARWGL